MRAGDLRHRLTIQEPVVTQNDTGEEEVAWSTLGTHWAQIEPLKGRERLIADGNNSTLDTRIRLRWSPLADRITAKCRLLHQDVTYNIQSIAHVRLEQRELEIMAISGLNNG